MKISALLQISALFLTTVSVPFLSHAQTEPQQSQQEQSKQQQADQARLQRIYRLRMLIEQDRQRAENEARANVRLVTDSSARQIDSPTVSGLRQQTNVSLARFEQQFRCLDVEIEATSGNTVVICGDNNGDINGSNVSAGRDLNLGGGTP
jgi:hypothetical protein